MHIDDMHIAMNAVFPIDAIRQGLPAEAADAPIAAGRLTAAELDRLAIPRKTLAHRRALGRLTPEQSDRLVRILRVIDFTEQTFADPARAHAWLRRPTTALGGEAPLDLLDTDPGARQVESLLGRIAHGIAA
ncbi:putative toxin-antitoxin system antitoxin component (TIGR02293 family) [Humitalea rosea]|uniref:Putative toxin-antitoxin system antitoxin component (TIGR02293 family) n=2 Tax=Humitalea rosea TaxID=990373 RepID=A0A2W7J737_9PROT|nr:putative toxin-antitoxin system antitoxin component (TIGR02293 family) [Humitalea rosea]